MPKKCPHCNGPVFSKGECKTLAMRRYAKKAADKAGSIAVGDEVIGPFHKRGIVQRIDPETGLFYLNTDCGGYEEEELRKVQETAARKPIKQFSDKRKTLNAIYSIIREEYLQNNPECLARLEGCSFEATQVHHRYQRTGLYLIQSHYFLPCCGSCHDLLTNNSEEAIRLGLSLSRLQFLPNVFSEREQLLLDNDI